MCKMNFKYTKLEFVFFAQKVAGPKIKTAFYYGLLLLFPAISYCQEGTMPTLDLNRPVSEQLPPLDSLIQMAINYNPTVKLNQELQGVAEQRIKLEKSAWTNSIRGYVDYSTGNQSLVVTGFENNNVNNLTNGYRAGVNLSLPLFDVVARKTRIKLQQQELAATEYKTQEIEIEVSRLVIDEYSNIITGQSLMKNQYEMVELARSNFQVAEIEYKTGNMEGAVFIRNAEILNIAQSTYENAKKEFSIAIQKLELLIGTPLSHIIK